MLSRENFPLVTFALSSVMLFSFLIPSTSEIYQALVFIPSSPKIYSLITYSFLHIDSIHLFGNLIFLIIAGLSLEEVIGRKRFLLIYFTSACLAGVFDVIGRIMLNISLNVPFAGSSGAVFGLLAAASLLKPNDKVPTILIILSILPLSMLLFNLPIFADEMVKVSVIVLSAVVIAILWFLGQELPMFVVIPIFLISWLAYVFTGLQMNVSDMVHIGGALGAMLIFFILPKET